MRTDIPEGTIVKMRRRGAWEYARIVRLQRNPDGTVSGGIKGFIPPPGDDFGIQSIVFDRLTDAEKKSAIYAVWKDNGTRLTRGKQ